MAVSELTKLSNCPQADGFFSSGGIFDAGGQGKG